MITSDQIADLLLKKQLGQGTTSDSRAFYEEPLSGRSSVMPFQIWTEADKIPDTAPDTTSGVVEKVDDLVLTPVAGVDNAFYHERLVDTIPFNYGDGSYNYTIRSSVNDDIPFGKNSWLLDTDAGVLTFHDGVPSDMPPKISFYRYNGKKGAGGGLGEIREATVTLNTLLYANDEIPSTAIFTFAIVSNTSTTHTLRDFRLERKDGLLITPPMDIKPDTTVSLPLVNTLPQLDYENDLELYARANTWTGSDVYIATAVGEIPELATLNSGGVANIGRDQLIYTGSSVIQIDSTNGKDDVYEFSCYSEYNVPLNLTDAMVYFTVKEDEADADEDALANWATDGSDDLRVTDRTRGTVAVYFPQSTKDSWPKNQLLYYTVSVLLPDAEEPLIIDKNFLEIIQ